MVDWKSRYAELIEQSERQQTRYKRRQQLLVSGFLSAIQLGRGLNKAVDTRLLATQRLLRDDKTKNVDLEQGVEALKRASETILEQRQEDLEEALRMLRKLCAQTRSLDVSSDTTQALKIIENDLKPKNASYIKLLSAISELQRIHKVAIKQGKSNGKGGFFDRLLSSSDGVETERVEEVSSEDIDLELDDSVEPDHGEVEESAAQEFESEKKTLGEVLRTSVMTLLQQFAREDDTRAIEQSVNAGITANQLPEILDSVCHVGMDVIFEERAEFQSSLSRINARLTESTNQIDSCIAIGENQEQLHDSFHQVLGERFSDMTEALEKAKDIDSLRTAINLSLSEATAALQSHKTQTADKALVNSLTSLSNQITHLSDMGRASQFRIDDKLKAASTDLDTGLPNRFVFQREAGALLKSGPVCVAICKNGLSQTLEQVRSFATCLNTKLPQHRVYRLGSNQFAVLMIGLSLQEAGVTMETVRVSVAGELSVAMSVGVAASSASDTAESVAVRADRLSQTGGNSVQLDTSS